MDDLKFNYNSSRSQKARIGAWFGQLQLIFLSFLTFLLLVLGVAVVVFGVSLGWVLIGFSVIPAMIIEWYRCELCHLAITKDTSSIDGILSGSVLGKLSKQPTPGELAAIISQLPGGQFMAIRFGIGPGFLRELTSGNSFDIQSVWQEALVLRSQIGSKNISAAILAVALIRCNNNYKTLLSHLQLDLDDLICGVQWYDYLRSVIDQHKTPKRTGGLARDWSFGWTPILDRFAINISQQVEVGDSSLAKRTTHTELIDQLLNIFSKNGRQNALLVGGPGVGKTEIVHAFAGRLLDAAGDIPDNLRFRQIFILDSAALIAAAPNRGEIEQLVSRVLNEAYSAKNIIICLDNAQLFFESGIGSVDITNILAPILGAGNLRMILTMDEQKFLQISRRNPEIANLLNKIMIPEPSREETIGIMQYQSIMLEFQNRVTYMYQSLVEAYRLGGRYVHDLVMPGQALKLLESAAQYATDGLVTAESVRQAVEKTVGVKISVATDSVEREKLLNLEDLIHERMINQKRAVSVVSDALRRARSGVRNQNRPIGTFLFLGPTGVGKTELSKALADIYFGGENQIIRLDMNEYANSGDMQRLIADGADNPNSLTASVMKQPFSVILLDEIEKAHPDVISTLLQMLDEGIMRDIKNREVSFRDAIIIATSNAGADIIREYIDRGYDVEQFEDKFVDELISSNQFRPEFLNRFDEIVMFKPLNENELLQVVDLMLADVNKTMSLQKISIDVDIEAKKYLVSAGYDPRLGARPMRRVIQRAVENTVAKQMLSGAVNPGDTIKISLDQVKQLIDSKNTAQRMVDGK